MCAAGRDESSLALDPPGAGPWLELNLSRLALGIAFRMMSRGAADRRFRREGDQIVNLACAMDPQLATKPVLIPRVWGIEDSSRSWSIYMTLAHLIIVHDTIADIIEHLAAGQSYSREVRTADVKPGYGCDAATIDRFQHGLTSYLARTSMPSNLCTRATHAHPWFGPLNAHQWHCLAALHETIHRRQILRIVRLLCRRQHES